LSAGVVKPGLRAALAIAAASSIGAEVHAQTALSMQSVWPEGHTLYENFAYFAGRLDKVSGGRTTVKVQSALRGVPPHQVLDEVHRKALDGAHAWSGYWVGRNKAAILLTGGPGGPFGMDMVDVLGWMHHGGGIDLANEFFQKELKLDVQWFPVLPAGPQALGWFKRPIRSLADLKGLKCRQSGVAAEVWSRLGMQVVDLAGEEIVPAAQRGVIDCAEWVGGVEDLRLGFQNVWKYHYTPGVHENVTVGELLINGAVWRGLKAEQRELIKTVASETFILWWTRWQRQNADALAELQAKHGVRVLRPPDGILLEFLRTWDKIAAEESARNDFFSKVHDSQRSYESVVVHAKRTLYPNSSFIPDHYFPARRGGGKKSP
jgi:TRAP-type mannitol/chloroaromatic compound transport system substrate-binding protein